MVIMISTINSEEDGEGGHSSEIVNAQFFRSGPERRHKSDIPVQRVGSEIYSQRESEERRSRGQSQRSVQLGQNVNSFSQRGGEVEREEIEKISEGAIGHQKFDDHEHLTQDELHEDELDPAEEIVDDTDSEQFREELIDELNHFQDEEVLSQENLEGTNPEEKENHDVNLNTVDRSEDRLESSSEHYEEIENAVEDEEEGEGEEEEEEEDNVNDEGKFSLRV